MTILSPNIRSPFDPRSFPVELELTIHDSEWDIFLAHQHVSFDLLAQETCNQTISDFCTIYSHPLPHLSISVLLTNDEEIKNINQQYRKKNKATNVLSFPMFDLAPEQYDEIFMTPITPIMLGDVVLSLPYLREEAERLAIAFEHHLAHLWVHGLLHLLGYDHINEHDAVQMETMEISILQKFMISSPYDKSL